MLDLLLAVLGGLAVALGLASRPLRRSPVTEPLAALVVGVVVGPEVLDLVRLPPRETVPALHIAAKIALAMSLMAVALRFPPPTYRAHAAPIVVLVTVVMVLMAAAGTAMAVLVAGLPLAMAALLGCSLSPTDPVLASSIVSGAPAEHDLPERLRAIISGESAANDALAFPLVFVALSVIAGQSVIGGVLSALGRVVLGAALGVLLGYVAGRLVLVSERHHDLEQSAFLALTLALALFVLGAVSLVGGEGILGVLAAGLAYSHAIAGAERREEWQVQEAINRFLILPVFTLLGLSLPWAAWRGLGWAPVLFTVMVLLLRRLPWLLLLHRPLRLGMADAVFAGWFGPIGVAALFYLSMAQAEASISEAVWAGGLMVIAVSTVVHGVTAAVGRRWYAAASQPSPD